MDDDGNDRSHVRGVPAERQLDEHCRALVEGAPVGILVVRADRVLYANAEAARVAGAGRAAALVGKPVLDLIHPDDRKLVQDTILSPRQPAPPGATDVRLLRRDGTLVTVAISHGPLEWGGRPSTQLVVQEVSTTWRADVGPVSASELLTAVTMPALDGIFCKDRHRRYTFCNPAVEHLLGLPAGWIIGRTPDELFAPEDAAVIREADEATLRGEPVDAVSTLHMPDGQRVLHVIQVPLRDSDGTITGLSGIVRDVTREHETERALRESEQRYALAIRAGKLAVWEVNVAEGTVRSDGSLQDLFGYDRASVTGDTIDWRSHMAEEDVARSEAMLAAVAEGRAQEATLEYRFHRADGSQGTMFATGRVVLDEAGRPAQPLRMLGTAQDVTERAHLAEQLRLSQKLEAVGRLAGGVAHDFNNLLTGILGNASLALVRSRGSRLVQKNLEDIVYAAERAAELTQQLLAFSRRQVLAPRNVSLNELVGRFRRMVERLLGEDLRLVVRLREPLWPVRVDPGQIEQVLANLAVNARDAMPQGGTLTIETQNVTEPPKGPGAPTEWVSLRVRDTGQGMSEEVRQRIFEPFFTTKPQGKGTGLGLSTVYGIVQQHEGQVQVSSEPGKGTEFRVLLPRSAEAGPAEPAPAPEPLGPGRGETVLVVEDEPLVRALCEEALQDAGYVAVALSSGEDALEWLATRKGSPDLIISDVVMPGISGPELAARVEQQRPGTRVLLMSGYPGDTLLAQGQIDERHFIGKPFTPTELLRRVREALDGGWV